MGELKDKLAKMLDAIINDKHEEAQVAFHGYLGDKMKQTIHGEETPEVDTPTRKEKE